MRRIERSFLFFILKSVAKLNQRIVFGANAWFQRNNCKFYSENQVYPKVRVNMVYLFGNWEKMFRYELHETETALSRLRDQPKSISCRFTFSKLICSYINRAKQQTWSDSIISNLERLLTSYYPDFFCSRNYCVSQFSIHTTLYRKCFCRFQGAQYCRHLAMVDFFVFWRIIFREQNFLDGKSVSDF